MSNHYLSYALEHSSRVFTLLNSNPYSQTSGSFDRHFWHFKTRPFSNSANQQGLTSLSLLFANDFQNNHFFENDFVLRQIKNIINYTKKIQKKDGSFDEWFFNERGWAGPTGYVLHSICKSYFSIEKYLNSNEKNEIFQIIQKASNHLHKSDEKHPLANHIAMAMLPIFESAKILNEDKLLRYYDVQKDRLFSLFDEDEGWSMEYDGADPGYQSATVSFLSHIHELNNDSEIANFSKNSLSFISHFCYPDGSFGGNIGSRNTTNIFYRGIEYWSHTPEATAISKWINENFHKQTLPHHHDDNYFLYRHYEVLDAGLLKLRKKNNDNIDVKLPYEKNFTRHFSQANITISSNENQYIVINALKGACTQVFNKQKSKISLYDSGIILKCKKTTLSSLWNNPLNSIEVSENEITCKGHLTKVSDEKFTPLTSLLFSIFMIIFGQNQKLSCKIKDFLRSILIFNKKKSNVIFKRTITIGSNSVQITTSFSSSEEISKIQIGGDFQTRFVPQSRYFNFNNSSSRFYTEYTNKSEVLHKETI